MLRVYNRYSYFPAEAIIMIVYATPCRVVLSQHPSLAMYVCVGGFIIIINTPTQKYVAIIAHFPFFLISSSLPLVDLYLSLYSSPLFPFLVIFPSLPSLYLSPLSIFLLLFYFPFSLISPSLPSIYLSLFFSSPLFPFILISHSLLSFYLSLSILFPFISYLSQPPFSLSISPSLSFSLSLSFSSTI